LEKDFLPERERTGSYDGAILPIPDEVLPGDGREDKALFSISG